MIKRTVKGWIPFWGDKWLFGSMRIEFDVTERGIWWDLMALAMKDDGYIRANEDTPYLSQQLAGMLIIPEDLLIKTIDKFVAANKYVRLKNGTLKIANWDKYCFTDRHMRRVQEQEMSAETDTMSKDADRQGEVADTRKERNGKEKNGKENIIKEKVTFNFETEKFENIKEKDIGRWKETYPACDIKQELLYMVDWLISNPSKKKSNYVRFISNWLRKQQDRGGTKKEFKPSQIGRSTKKTTLEQDEYYKARQKKEAEIRAKYKRDISDIRKVKDKKAWDILQEKIADELREWSMNYRESKGGQLEK